MGAAEASQHRILSVMERLTDHNAAALTAEDRSNLSGWLLKQAPPSKSYGRNRDQATSAGSGDHSSSEQASASSSSDSGGGGISSDKSTCASPDVEQRVRRINRRLVIASVRPLRQLNGASYWMHTTLCFCLSGALLMC
jgi:hypothetical protein